MKKVLFVLVLFCLAACNFLAACNYDAGECWVRGEEEGGVGGGGPIAPGWGGDYGDAPPEPQDGTGPSGSDADAEVTKQPLGYGPLAFKFVVTMEDDGKDGAGGWQKATTKLSFTRVKPADDSDGCNPGGTTEVWTCGLTIGMPVRTHLETISTTEAAKRSAWGATKAGDEVKRLSNEPKDRFCTRYRDEMKKLMNKKWNLGARVTPPDP
jgi:hypothetical protein